jgi:hypothetical protein
MNAVPQVVDWVVPIGRYLGKSITYPAGMHTYPTLSISLFDWYTFQTTVYLSYLAGIDMRFTSHFKTCVCFKAGERKICENITPYFIFFFVALGYDGL